MQVAINVQIFQIFSKKILRNRRMRLLHPKTTVLIFVLMIFHFSISIFSLKKFFVIPRAADPGSATSLTSPTKILTMTMICYPMFHGFCFSMFPALFTILASLYLFGLWLFQAICFLQLFSPNVFVNIFSNIFSICQL